MSASCEQVITLAGDLHARPAGALAVAAGRFASAVSVTAGGHTADAKSVLGVMGLGATSGQHVTVSAAGPDAQEAVAALITILTQATKVGGLRRNQAGRLCRGSRCCAGRRKQFGLVLGRERPRPGDEGRLRLGVERPAPARSPRSRFRPGGSFARSTLTRAHEAGRSLLPRPVRRKDLARPGAPDTRTSVLRRSRPR